jgi:hypothetical protein
MKSSQSAVVSTRRLTVLSLPFSKPFLLLFSDFSMQLNNFFAPEIALTPTQQEHLFNTLPPSARTGSFLQLRLLPSQPCLKINR